MVANKGFKLYVNNIKVKYSVDSNRELAYTYNRGYIMGLSDGKAISTAEGFELIDLNGKLRNKKEVN